LNTKTLPRGDREPYTACPLCSGANFDHLLTADWSGHPLFENTGGRLSSEMRWMQCVDCAHQFTDGYFRPEAFAILMGHANAGQVLDRNFEGQRTVSARMIEKVLPYAQDGTWLDVGFGNGSLLMTAQEFGFDVVGCDLRQSSVDAIGFIGIPAHCKDITELELDRACSVISMADVLEHMPFPQTGLKAARRLLREGGVLFVSMPNCESPAWQLLNGANANPYWPEVEHYHNFGRSTLYSLLEQHGFRPVRYGVSERYRVCMEVVAVKA
jgi:SAM-dependent methyltransferase